MPKTKKQMAKAIATARAVRKDAVMAALKAEMKDAARVADEVVVAAAAAVVTVRVHANDWMLKANRLHRSKGACRQLAPRDRTVAVVLIGPHAAMTVDVAVNEQKTANARSGVSAPSVVAVIVPKMANGQTGRTAGTTMSVAKHGTTVPPKHAPSATTNRARKAVKAVRVVPSAGVVMAAARIALLARTTAAPTRPAHRKSIA